MKIKPKQTPENPVSFHPHFCISEVPYYSNPYISGYSMAFEDPVAAFPALLAELWA